MLGKNVLFENRTDAAIQLGQQLKNTIQYDPKNSIVIGLPRGGVVTGYHVADQMHLPLDIVVPRKIGCPGNSEFAVGAITEDGCVDLNHTTLRQLGITERDLEAIIDEERREANRRLKVYRGNRGPLDLKNKTVFLVDDGIATGATIKAAINSLRNKKPERIVVAVPVAPPDTAEKVSKLCDQFVALATPSNFRGVGQFYKAFGQTTDNEVITFLKKNEQVLSK